MVLYCLQRGGFLWSILAFFRNGTHSASRRTPLISYENQVPLCLVL